MRRSPLGILFVAVFLDLLGFGIIIPLQPFYARTLGASGFEIGLLSASYSVAQFAFSPIWGRLSDRHGRRPVLRLGMLLQAVGFVVFGLSHDLWMLFAARVLAGIGGANVSTAQAYIADVTRPEERAKGMGLLGAAFGLGFVIGPALSGVLAKLWSPTVPIFVAAALSFTNLLVASRFLPESLKPGAEAVRRPSFLETLARGASSPRLALLWLASFVATFAFAAFEPTFVLYAQWRFGFDEGAVGGVFAVVGVILVVMQGAVVGRLSRRTGEGPLAVAGILLTGAAIGLLPHAPSGAWLVALMGLLAIGNSLAQPTLLSLVSKASPLEHGVVMGVNQGLASLARAGGPPSGGRLFDLPAFAHALPFWFASALHGVAFLVAVLGLFVAAPSSTAPAPSEAHPGPPRKRPSP